MDLHRREGTERGEKAERRKSERSMGQLSTVNTHPPLAVMWPPSGPATRDTNVAGRRAWPRRTGRAAVPRAVGAGRVRRARGLLLHCGFLLARCLRNA